MLWRRRVELKLPRRQPWHRVSLYRSTDAPTSAQVKRGLSAAIEQLSDTHRPDLPYRWAET
jgi:hypothetical protein